MKDNRITAMIAMHRAGATLSEIGERYALTKQRVHQILKCAGVAIREGGFASKVRSKRAASAAAKEARQISKFGCTNAERHNIIRLWLSRGCANPMRAFNVHRVNARRRRIEFKFNFKQWMDVWGDKYRDRGIGRMGLCMCRIGDTGPYSPDNVFIATHVINIIDYHTRKAPDLRSLKDLC